MKLFPQWWYVWLRRWEFLTFLYCLVGWFDTRCGMAYFFVKCHLQILLSLEKDHLLWNKVEDVPFKCKESLLCSATFFLLRWIFVQSLLLFHFFCFLSMPVHTCEHCHSMCIMLYLCSCLQILECFLQLGCDHLHRMGFADRDAEGLPSYSFYVVCKTRSAQTPFWKIYLHMRVYMPTCLRDSYKFSCTLIHL